MDDPIGPRLQRLLEITLRLRETIDELHVGLTRQVERASRDRTNQSSKRRRRRLRR